MATVTNYSDISISYREENKKRLGRDIDNVIVTEVDAIYNALDNLFAVVPGERLFEPEVGLSLEQFLFEPMDSTSELQALTYLYTEIPIQEPRLSLILQDSSIIPDYDNHSFEFNLVFSVVSVEGSLLEYKNTVTK